jgi:hypothetical protein
MNRSQYLDDSGHEPGCACRDVETGNCNRQAKPSRTRAAWIDELHAITLGHHWLVRVAGYDDVEAGGSRVNVHFLHVMQDVNADTFQFQCEVNRDLRGPGTLVIVSPDRIHGRYGAQLLENLGPADVPCVNDVLYARKGTDSFRAKQSVCVGDEAYRFQWLAAPRCCAPQCTGVWILADRRAVFAPCSSRCWCTNPTCGNMAGIEAPLPPARRSKHARRYQQSVLPALQVWDFGPAVMQRSGARLDARHGGVIAIHHDWGRYVLIFCQISDFQSYNANNKSNKSI